MIRIFGALLVIVLLTMAVVSYLQSRQARESLDAVTTMADQLREPDVRGTSLDPAVADRVLDTLETLAGQPTLVSDHVEDLQTIAATAARWAEAAPTPSLELRASVAIRSAADDLRSFALRGRELSLSNARRHIAEARAALAGELPPGSATDAMRDRLENLGRGREEQLQELDETLSR